MRGVPNRSTQIAPRRWCGAVLPPWCGVYHLVYHMVVWCNDSLPPPPGWHIWDAVLWSPHVADTPVGEIRGYAQRQPPTGVGNYLAFGHHLPTAESRRWHPIRDGVSAVEHGGCCNAANLPIARHLRSCAGFTRYIRNVCQRYAPVAQDHYYCLLQKVCPAPRGGRARGYILSEAWLLHHY